MTLNLIYLLKFKKKIFEKFDIRIFNKQLLYPIYDENKNLIDTILIEPSQLNNPKETEIKINLASSYIFGQQAQINSTDVIYITDQIVHSVALWDALDKPSLVINSVDCLTPKVSNFL
jgi:hypothetical protein